VSLSSSHSRAAGLLAIAALTAGGITAGPANAKKLSAKQKSAIRAQLAKEVKKNPKAVTKRSFIKRASLVEFTLPATIRIGTKKSDGTFAANPSGQNSALIDLGPSLGTRKLGLNGSLPAEIKFHDAYDGGGLGNVDLVLNPGGTGGLNSTSVPLLANPDVTTQTQANGGCTDAAYIPNDVDALSALTTTNTPGENDLGDGAALPGAVAPQDVVLRTGSLNLKIASPSLSAGQTTDNTLGTTTVGKSGGQANLFGSIPGKGVGVDVTANLVTNINSILRETDMQDPGNNATAFNCRQAWTGTVPNTLSGIKLQGSLRISPAIMADGKLRIAKSILSSPTPSQVALTACLMPMQAYAVEVPGNLGTGNPVINPASSSPAPGGTCNSSVSTVMSAALGVSPFSTTGLPQSGYTTSENGSTVSVAGSIKVQDLHADVLIGQNQ
jgi:hypothetical protein